MAGRLKLTEKLSVGLEQCLAALIIQSPHAVSYASLYSVCTPSSLLRDDHLCWGAIKMRIFKLRKVLAVCAPGAIIENENNNGYRIDSRSLAILRDAISERKLVVSIGFLNSYGGADGSCEEIVKYSQPKPCAIIEAVRSFLERHGGSKFVPAQSAWRARNGDRHVFGYRLRGTGSYNGDFVFNAAGFAEAVAGFDPRAAADALAKAGLLIKDPEGKRTRSERIGGKSVRVFRVRHEILCAPQNDVSNTMSKLSSPNNFVDANAPPNPKRKISRSERRLIFTKIEDVYIDEESGYSSGWSDAKIASHLGVPAAWVAEVRDQHFGPDISPKIAQAAAEAKKFLAEAAVIVGEIRSLRARADQLVQRANAVERALTKTAGR